MNTARQALIASLSIAAFAFSAAPAMAAPQQADISTLPTITIVGKRLSHTEPLHTVTIIGKRLSPQEQLAMAQQEDILPTITIVGKRLSRDQKAMLVQQDSNLKKAALKRNLTLRAIA